MIDATAIILTKNEEKNICDCITSMRGFARRVVVVDSGSTDRTVELAKQLGADVYFHEFEYYAKQFNWSIDNTSIDTEWIIRLDADERFPVELRQEITECVIQHEGTDMNGITIEADLYFLGRCLKHGPRNKRKIMLFKHGHGRIEDRRRDAHSILTDGYSISMSNRFLHYDIKSLTSYIDRYNLYATREMLDYVDFLEGVDTGIMNDKAIQRQRKKKFGLYYKLPLFLRAWMWFVYNYFFRLGFLDGSAGFLYCFFECYWYRMLVDAKIKEYLQREDQAATGEDNS